MRYSSVFFRLQIDTITLCFIYHGLGPCYNKSLCVCGKYTVHHYTVHIELWAKFQNLDPNKIFGSSMLALQQTQVNL